MSFKFFNKKSVLNLDLNLNYLKIYLFTSQKAKPKFE